jgi:hypothetical protein
MMCIHILKHIVSDFVRAQYIVDDDTKTGSNGKRKHLLLVLLFTALLLCGRGGALGLNAG